MTLVEFAEKTSPMPLTEWQKQLLAAYEQAKKENKQIVAIITPRTSSRRTLTEIIREFKKEQGHGENHTSERRGKDNKVNSNVT